MATLSVSSMRRVPVAIVYALIGAIACSTPSITAAQGFYHKGPGRTPEEGDRSAVAASKAAAKAMADSIAADCARRKQTLTDQLSALTAAWKEADSNGDERKARELYRDYLLTLSDWEYLQQDCPGVGDPPPGIRGSAAPPTGGAKTSGGAGGGGGGSSGGGGSGGGGAAAGGQARGGSASAAPTDSASQKMYEAVGLWSLARDSAAPKSGVLIPSLGERLQRGLDSTMQTIASARPASDYTQRASAASTVMFAVDPHASAADSAASSLLGALQSERASLGGFTQSYSRFLGARDAHDAPAMLQQALVMLEFADSALSQERSAAVRRRLLFTLAVAALHRLDSMRQARHRSWDEVITHTAAGTTSASDDAAKVLRSAGVPDSQVLTAVKSAQPPRVQAIIDATHAEASADSAVRARLDSMRAGAEWPALNDQAQLEHARALAMSAVLQGDYAQILAAPDSSASGSATSVATGSNIRKSVLWAAGFALLAFGAFGIGRVVRQRRANFG